MNGLRSPGALFEESERPPDASTRSEEKIRIVLEGFRREATVNNLCRREGIRPTPTTDGPRSSWRQARRG